MQVTLAKTASYLYRPLANLVVLISANNVAITTLRRLVKYQMSCIYQIGLNKVLLDSTPITITIVFSVKSSGQPPFYCTFFSI